MKTLRTTKSKFVKDCFQRFVQQANSMADADKVTAINALLNAKKELARENLWDFCEALSPDFYKEDRFHLMELTTLLTFLYEGKLMVPKYFVIDGKQIPVEAIDIDLSTDDTWKKFMMNMPPQHGKSRTLTNFSAWCFGKNNAERVLLASYNDEAATDFSKYTRDIIKQEKSELVKNDLVYSDIFPDTKLKFGSATYKQWALEGQHFNYKGGGVGGSFTSKGGTILIIDDPIKNAEEAFSQLALDRAWNFITGTFLSRVSAEGGEPIEILNMTRWAEKDPCGHHMEGKKLYYLGDTPFEIDGQTFYFPHLWCFGKWLLVKMEVQDAKGEMLCPAIFGKERYKELEEIMPEAILKANYHQQPIDIEGKVFKRDELLYFKQVDLDKLIKEGMVDGVIAYADVADEGEDNFSKPIGYMVGDKCYIADVVFTKDKVEKTSLTVAKKLIEHNVQISYYESNNGGKTFALLVKEKYSKLNAMMHKLSTTTFKWRPNWQNKETRIYMESEFIKKHMVFLDPSEYKKNSEYGMFMQEIWDFNVEGKNVHDDAPDSVHGLTILFKSIIKKKQKHEDGHRRSSTKRR